MIEQRALHVLHWWLIRIQSCTPIPSIYLWRQHITSKLTNYNRSGCYGTIMLILPTAATMIERMTCNEMHWWRSTERTTCPIPSIYLWQHHITSKLTNYNRSRCYGTIMLILPTAATMIERMTCNEMHWWRSAERIRSPIPSIYIWQHHITSKLTNYNRSRCYGTIMLILPTAATMIETMTCNVLHCWRSAGRIRSPIPSIYIWQHHITSKFTNCHHCLPFDTIMLILPTARATKCAKSVSCDALMT